MAGADAKMDTRTSTSILDMNLNTISILIHIYTSRNASIRFETSTMPKRVIGKVISRPTRAVLRVIECAAATEGHVFEAGIHGEGMTLIVGKKADCVTDIGNGAA